MQEKYLVKIKIWRKLKNLSQKLWRISRKILNPSLTNNSGDKKELKNSLCSLIKNLKAKNKKLLMILLSNLIEF